MYNKKRARKLPASGRKINYQIFLLRFGKPPDIRPTLFSQQSVSEV